MKFLNLKMIFEKRNSGHRWFFLFFAVLYSVLSINSLFQYPFAQSSLGLSYFMQWFIPTMLMLVHFVFNKVFTWLIIFVFFTLSYIYLSLSKFEKDWNWSNNAKWDHVDLMVGLVVNILVFILSLLVFYLLRPRINKIL